MELKKDTSTWRILIVDDEIDNLNLASDFLEFSGATTCKANDGQAGLDLIESFNPNIILLDLGMPRLDGWEMQRRLRARPELARVPIIALTALAMKQDAEKVRSAGFDGYVTKPFRVKALFDALIHCVEVFSPAPEQATKSELTFQENG